MRRVDAATARRMTELTFGAFALIVDAKDTDAKGFHEHDGLRALVGQALTRY